MPSVSGFWSYAHADDDAEAGRIADLARAVAQEYALQVGEDLSLFLDRDSLKWGNDWEDRVDEALARGFFFIPVLTPRYFRSEQCRREMQVFIQRAQILNLTSLILPIRYIDFPALRDPDSSDELIKAVRRIQWEDWHALRLEDAASSSHRRGVAKMAGSLVLAIESAQAADFAAAAQRAEDGGEGGGPGLLDRVAGVEGAFEDWHKTIDSIGSYVEQVGQLVEDAVDVIAVQDGSGGGFAARLGAARQLAEELEAPARGVADLSREFTEQLIIIDSGVRVIIDQAPRAIESDLNARGDICEFFDVIRGLATTSSGGLIQLRRLADSVEAFEAISMDLRPPLRTFRHGITVLADGIQVTESWVRLIDESGIDCESRALPATRV